MEAQELARLRQRYQDATGDDTIDPAFKPVAALLYTGKGNRKLPFAGVPTLLDAPYRQQYTGLDAALIGVPMDLGVTNRPGARFGPRAVRQIERVGPYNHQTKMAPATLIQIADIGDVPLRSRYSLEQSIEDIEAFFHRVRDAGVIPVSVGGDHSITYPILKALGHRAPVGLIHIDAHCDTGGAHDGSKFHHGGPFRQAVLDGVLDPVRTVQIGIRGAAEIFWEFSYDAGMTVIHIEDYLRMGAEAVIERAREVVGHGPVYISFDVDGLDPAYAPGTGTPEVGGLTPREAQQILRGLQGLQVIGGDVVEIAPQYDPTSNTVQIGAQMLFEILCLVAAVRRPQPPASR